MRKKPAPAWALRAATAEDHELACDAQRRGRLQVEWPDLDALRRWAKQQGWPTPWFGFQKAFLNTMLESRERFALAFHGSGIALQIPKQRYTISAETVRRLDELYAERSPDGRPTLWGSLVEELREIRRAVEAGVVVTIEGGPDLGTWQGFYTWAHGRYHALEDGYDAWIGSDEP